ncbi:MAG TPA: hypothetical protein VGO73_01175 [Pyrinomonadaceae bacterium]|jgi:hypothetical protein|nr:hypothetical protein [Pyrinomonadaceae bacterium]
MSNGDANKPDNSTKGPWLFELLKLAVPSLITIFFGYIIYGAQMDTQSKVAASQDILKSQLAFQSALKEEFYKRQLSRYEDACKGIAVTEAALDDASVTTENLTKAYDVIYQFNQLNKSNTLYWSHGLQNRLDQFWALGVDKLKGQKWDDPVLNERISKEITALHEQMKNDLNVADLSTVIKQTK